MPKSKSKESSVDMFMVIVIVVYVLFCAWWQYEFVYPFIKEGDYWEAFDIFIGWNPITPAWLYGLLLIIGYISGWITSVWVFFFGE